MSSTPGAARRRRGGRAHEEIDPVCGMTVDVADARYRTVHDGRTYYFCSAGCLESFEADPARYVTRRLT